jgi:hypothetical protein
MRNLGRWIMLKEALIKNYGPDDEFPDRTDLDEALTSGDVAIDNPEGILLPELYYGPGNRGYMGLVPGFYPGFADGPDGDEIAIVLVVEPGDSWVKINK